MIANCEGCETELAEVITLSKKGYHFAGSGLFEEGHLLMIMVDDLGNVIIE